MKLFSCLALGALLASLSSISSASSMLVCQEKATEEDKSKKCGWYLGTRENGVVTDNAVYAGTENGLTVHVCKDPAGTIGKLINGESCWVPWYGKEYELPSYYVLKFTSNTTYKWDRITSPISVFGNEVYGDNDSGNLTFICRVYDERTDNYTVGKLIRGKICFYPMGGHEYAADPRNQGPLYVDVLRYQD